MEQAEMQSIDSAILRGVTQLSLLSGHLVQLLGCLTQREAASVNSEPARMVHADLLSALELQKQVVAEHFALVRSMLHNQRPQTGFAVLQGNEKGRKVRTNLRRRVVEARVKQGEQSFTTRQRQIVELVALGYDNKEIAHSLGLAEQTVKNHLHIVFEKAGISRRAKHKTPESDSIGTPEPKDLFEGDLPQQEAK
jgi:ATP/maltotriose-dependent transcriptional regulator MalT